MSSSRWWWHLLGLSHMLRCSSSLGARLQRGIGGFRACHGVQAIGGTAGAIRLLSSENRTHCTYQTPRLLKLLYVNILEQIYHVMFFPPVFRVSELLEGLGGNEAAGAEKASTAR